MSQFQIEHLKFLLTILLATISAEQNLNKKTF